MNLKTVTIRSGKTGKAAWTHTDGTVEVVVERDPKARTAVYIVRKAGGEHDTFQVRLAPGDTVKVAEAKRRHYTGHLAPEEVRYLLKIWHDGPQAYVVAPAVTRLLRKELVVLKPSKGVVLSERGEEVVRKRYL